MARVRISLVLESYCDTSGIFDHRFQTIAAITGSHKVVHLLRDKLSQTLESKHVSEAKFADVKKLDSSEFGTAETFLIDSISSFVASGLLRVDVLTWDTTDSRHSIPGRDDVQNLSRMYYHLLRHIAIKSHPESWNIFLDVNERVEFRSLLSCLSNSSIKVNACQIPMLMEMIRKIENFGIINKVTEIDSKSEPLVQLADIFAGITRFSFESGKQCWEWIANNSIPTQQILPGLSELTPIRRSDECRYQLILTLYNLSKKHRLYVSLKTEKHLVTKRSSSPLNFWFYIPQNENDIAPKKVK
jgi:hypothetical protein